jgi:hypothetical protein
MSPIDPFSPAASDPFYVPDKTSERVYFFAAVVSAGIVIAAPFTLRLTLMNAVVEVGLAALALSAFARGMGERRRRLNRAEQVEQLRASLLEDDSTRN